MLASRQPTSPATSRSLEPLDSDSRLRLFCFTATTFPAVIELEIPREPATRNAPTSRSGEKYMDAIHNFFWYALLKMQHLLLTEGLDSKQKFENRACFKQIVG